MRRRALAAFVLVLVTSATACGGGADAPRTADGHPTATPPLGVHAHLTWDGVDRPEVRRQLDRAAAAGARLVRVDVGWRWLQPDGPDRWSAASLRKVDVVVEEAARRRLPLLLTLLWSPRWASDSGARNAAPRDPRAYGAALGALVRRYGPRVRAWEVWNEPNLRRFWVSDDPVGDYVALLRAAHRAAKDALPATTVVGGALAAADHNWVEALERRGARGSYDALSIHPYSGDRSPLDAGGAETMHSFVAGVPAVREVMLRHGDDSPLWLTELGWSTCRIEGCVGEGEQARHLGAAVAALARWPFVRAAVWYGLQDTSADPRDQLGGFGLLRHDGAPKPAFAAFARAAGGGGATGG